MEAMYTLKDIRGDYAILQDGDGVETPVALALLPLEIQVGDTISWKNFVYAIV